VKRSTKHRIAVGVLATLAMSTGAYVVTRRREDGRVEIVASAPPGAPVAPIHAPPPASPGGAP
jgi:hypothetical protein